MGSSALQTSDHKYQAYLIWIKCSLQCSPLTRLLESHHIFPFLRPSRTSHFLIKKKRMLERFLHSTAIVLFVDLSCGRDAGSRRLCYSTPTDCEEGKKRTPVAPVIGSVPESPPLLPASPLLGLHTSLPDLSLTTSVCQSRQDFTHLLHNISSVCRKKKKKKKTEREGKTDQSVWKTWQTQ